MRRERPSMPQVRHEVIAMTGGLDLVTPTLSLKPGVLRDSLNYEVSVTGGYSRILGYERFSGKANPSEATVSTVTLSSVTLLPLSLLLGVVVTGGTSGATAVVIAISGSDTLVFTNQSGTFVLGETITSGPIPSVGVVASLASPTFTGQQSAQYRNLAADYRRSLIAAVPGSGPIRGVKYFKGTVYAWRDNVGATAMDIYKSTSTGWTNVPLGYELSFTAGLAAGIVEGNTVTGLVSGATGVVSRIAIQSGAFSTNNAAGRLILSSTTGVFVAAEALQVAGTNRATASGAASAITLLPGGRVEIDVGSFGGSAAASGRMYGADGVNRGFEFDGAVYVPIVTGMSPDVPTRAKVHLRHLLFAFGSSLQFSGIGAPYSWTVVFGAGEIALDDTITDWIEQPGGQTTGALVIYCRNSTQVLYGTSSATWNLVPFSPTTGGLAYTAQVFGAGYVMDDLGVLSLSTSQNYGNFADATLTTNIRPFVQSRRSKAIASSVNREKNQYRLFFSDGYGLYITVVNGRLRGCMPVYFPNPVAVASEGESPDGAETGFFGSTDGFVYRLDAGTSFDGASIPATGLLVFGSQGDSRVLKTYKRGSLEIQGTGYAELSVGYNLAYAESSRIDQGVTTTYATSLSAPYWDSFIWDAFTWDGVSLTPSELEILGTAENIAVRVDSNSDYFDAYTLNSLILHYIVRRGLR